MSLISLHILFRRTGKSWLYLLLLCLPFGAMAQDEDEGDTTTVMVDSAVVAPPREADNNTTGSTDESTEEKYTPAAPELRHVPDSVVMAMKQDKDYAYANDPSYWAKEKEKEAEASSETNHKGFWDYFYDLFQNGGVRTITYIILGVILVLIIYRIIVVNNLYMTGASRRRKEEVIEGEVSEIEDTNLDQKIQAAVQAKQFRPAIRLMYLKALRSLNDKGWIRYHAQSTNYEYMNQVQPYGIGNEFRFMTHVYEYVWYGEFALTEDQFGKVYQNFQQFFNTIKA